MKAKRSLLLLFLLILPTVAAGIIPLGAQQQLDLQGVWKIVSYTRDGRKLEMEAMMVITRQHFTRVLMEKNRRKFEGFDFRQVEKLTPEQHRLVAEDFPRFNASAGTYRVEGDTFYFTSAAHHNPGAVGNESERKIDLKGDRLRLYGPAGSGVLDETWERVEKF